ncbi:MAG: hypothetical protein IPI66_07265 [Chitinophagaceae bacterium]|nr:hypothetical protein [Chitinophagaceae bacterium]
MNLERRQKNSIEISLPDTIPANLSLSVTDADIDDQPRNTNIITGMLLGGDVRGYIHDPAYYFGPETDTAAAFRLDLVMLTHGWRRYQWDLLRNQQRPGIRFPQDNYLRYLWTDQRGRIEK